MKTFKPWHLSKLLRITLIAILPAAYYLELGIPPKSIFTNLTFWIFCFGYFLCISQMLLTSKSIRIYKIDKMLFIFAAYVLVCTLWSPFLLEGLRKVAEFMLFTLPIVYFIRFFVRDETEIEQVMQVSLFIAFVLVLYALVSFVSSGKTVGRVTLRMVHPVAMGLYCALHAYSSVYFFLKEKKRTLRIYYLFASIIFSLVLLLNGSRASILGLSLLLIWLFLRKLIKRNVLPLIVLLFFLMGSVFIANRFIPILDYLTYRIFVTGTPQDVAGQTRIMRYKKSINSIYENPIVGEGTGSNPWGYTHNIFLEIASENGVIGLFLLFAIIFLFLKIKRKIKREEIYELIMGLFMISFFVGLFSFSYFLHRYLLFSLGLILLSYHLSLKKAKGCISQKCQS